MHRLVTVAAAALGLVNCTDLELPERSRSLPLSAGEPEQAPGAALSPEDEEWAARHIPLWKVYQRGADLPAVNDAKDYLFPRAVDEATRIVLVREERGGFSEKRITLSLYTSWMAGEVYLENRMDASLLSPLDMIVIEEVLREAQGKVLSPPPPSTFDYGPQSFEEPWGGLVFGPPISAPGNDHRGGPPPGGGNPSRPSGPGSNAPRTRVDPRNPANWPHRGGGGPKYPRSDPNDPAVRAAARASRDAWEKKRNGVLLDDPMPQLAPADAEYTPAPGEQKEVFKCEGRVFVGYKGGCIDFQSKPVAAKWSEKIGGFLQRNSDAFDRYIYENFWSGGKNPACQETCDAYADVTCDGFTLGFGLVCIGLTRGACVKEVAGFIAGFEVFPRVKAVCLNKIRGICSTRICIH